MEADVRALAQMRVVTENVVKVCQEIVVMVNVLVMMV